MKERWIVVLVGLPLLLALLLAAPAWGTLLVVAILAGAAAWELLHTACPQTPAEVFAIAVVGAVLNVLAEYLALDTQLAVTRWAMIALLFAVAVRCYEKEREFPFSAVCAAFVGGIILPALYASLLHLRCEEPFGRLYVLMPFGVAFAGDALSMYFGIWFGKRKMAPRVSPHKTWAGFLGGPIGGAAIMALLGWGGAHFLSYEPRYGLLLLAGAAADLVGQLGDLSMSFVKRGSGTKDFSHLFLTHGGVLDRFDSLLLIAPLIYFFVLGGIL